MERHDNYDKKENKIERTGKSETGIWTMTREQKEKSKRKTRRIKRK